MSIRFFKTVAIGLGIIYLLAMLVLFGLQRHLMYFPSQENRHPKELGLTDIAVENIRTPDSETIVAWYAPAIGNKPTVLFLHGNAGEISDRRNRLLAYRARGLGVLFVSWRGYGGSTGSPSEVGIHTDAKAAYDWLIAKGVRHQKIVVVGESLGTGAAVRLTAEQPVGALILGAPYTAAVDVAAERFPWLPVRLLMKDQFCSSCYIDSVQAPTLILHGTLDGVIPYSLGQTLYDAVLAPKKFVSFENEGHGVLFRSTLFAEEIKFISEVFPE